MNAFEKIVKAENDRILIASHRGICGGNIPPNTQAAFEIGLRSGADIIECDVCRLSDGTFVMFHPGTEEESTSFEKGAIPALTWEELSRHHYHSLCRAQTQYPFCRLDDALEFMKGRCYINLDKAVDQYYEYLPEIVGAVRRHGMTDQVILKSDPKPHCLDAVEKYAPDIRYMTVLRGGDGVTESILKRGINFYGAELVWSEPDSPLASREYVEKMHTYGKKLWVNAIVFSYRTVLAGGRTDDLALTADPADHWGWMADMGYDIIQTDWPYLLRDYLKKSGKLKKSFLKK